MELRNALSVCLIALFSATLVVLIARSLDSQAAARLEPPLARIAEQLEAIRAAGGIPQGGGGGAATASVRDGVVVYYFHGNVRCPTCRSIESQAYDAVCRYFGSQLQNGQIVWKILNYEAPANTQYKDEFSLQVPVVVLAQMKRGEIQQWKRLDEVWGLVDDREAFAQDIREKIEQMLSSFPAESTSSVDGDAAAVPIPGNATNSQPAATDDILLPDGGGE